MSEASAGITQEHFEKICGEYYKPLFQHVSRLTGSQTEAEEITQTVFLRFLRLLKRKQWKLEVQHVRAYLTKIADNLCSDMWERRAKERPVSYDDEKTREALEREALQSDDSVSRIENRIYYKELYQALPLNVILGGCSVYEKQILLLRKVDGMSVKEIAPLVGKDVCQVRYDLQKLEARIRYRVRKLTDGKSGNNPR